MASLFLFGGLKCYGMIDEQFNIELMDQLKLGNMQKQKLKFLALTLLALSACSAGENRSIAASTQSLCAWSAETPAIDGKKVRFVAFYFTDFYHGALFHDPTCKRVIDVRSDDTLDGSYLELNNALRADFATRKLCDYKVDVSGVLRVAPPSRAIMDPRRDSPTIVIQVERIWTFERMPCA